MDEIDEEIARLWAQALQGETRETARARRAREADNYLERGYYRDPANLAIKNITREEKKTNGKRKSKRTTR
ncbi:hypothetical protein [Dermabacter hominis]|uniref:hypothetical protein n=1 Tax=Dermabacter hominis TaxID=36740 RepID=UPI0021A6024B|nr:hypothetical protein [Dermabacter hominis]MCT1790602.1 hypothetical protein [Dermabacter hominis]